MTNTTSVQISREASNLLTRTSKSSGLAKSHLADVAIKYFFDPAMNPALEEALLNLSSGRRLAEEAFVQRIFQAKQTNGTNSKEDENGKEG